MVLLKLTLPVPAVTVTAPVSVAAPVTVRLLLVAVIFAPRLTPVGPVRVTAPAALTTEAVDSVRVVPATNDTPPAVAVIGCTALKVPAVVMFTPAAAVAVKELVPAKVVLPLPATCWNEPMFIAWVALRLRTELITTALVPAVVSMRRNWIAPVPAVRSSVALAVKVIALPKVMFAPAPATVVFTVRLPGTVSLFWNSTLSLVVRTVPVKLMPLAADENRLTAPSASM